MTALLYVLFVLVILGNAPRLPIVSYPCGCSRRMSVVFAARRFCEEVVECWKEPSWDEFSDSLMMLSELFRSLTLGVWKWVLPGGEMSWTKGYLRYSAWGCPRSYRHRCANARWDYEEKPDRFWIIKLICKGIWLMMPMIVFHGLLFLAIAIVAFPGALHGGFSQDRVQSVFALGSALVMYWAYLKSLNEYFPIKRKSLIERACLFTIASLLVGIYLFGTWEFWEGISRGAAILFGEYQYKFGLLVGYLY